jgi:hypothetical protein
MGSFDADTISPNIPYTYAVGGGYPDTVASGRNTVDVLGLGSIPVNELRSFQESARPGMPYALLGGYRSKRRQRRKTYRRNKKTRNTRKYR